MNTSRTQSLVGSFRIVIDKATIPMYLAVQESKKHFVIRHCNSQLAHLLNCDMSALLGSPLAVLVERFSARVPLARREQFYARQLDLAANLENRLNPRTYRVEYVDNRDLEGNFYNRLYRVSIHSEIVQLGELEPQIGVFSVYHVVETNEVILESPTFDVFISYAAEDAAMADELRTDLQNSGVKCFMAGRDIFASSEWQDSIQAALIGSRKVLLLLTPNSINRPWVLMEAGAAWALRKPLIPALAYVSSSNLVGPLRQYQARPVETTGQRKALVDELACR